MVVEAGSLAAAGYCGKLFADFGADVVKAEPTGGDPLRRAWPTVKLADGTEESGWAAWLNTNKRSVTVEADDDPLLKMLLARADVLIDARGPRGAGSRHAELRALNPALTIVSLSWFGESGPYAGFAGAENVVRALAGLGRLTGPAEGPPELLCEAQAAITGGLSAFSAALAARFGEATGRRFELSLHEISAVLAEYEGSVARGAPDVPERRRGRNRFRPTFPLGIYPCREGWIGVTVITPEQWRSFCDLLGLTEEGGDPRFQFNHERFAVADELEPRFAGRFAARTAVEWFELGRARRLPMVVVPDVPTLLAQPVHRARGAWGKVQIGEAAFEAPAVPYRLGRGAPALNGPAPRAGEHTADYARIGAQPAPVSAPAPWGRPLAGLRIVDLTMGWAGPLATRQMADLGADVIKVEACSYPDWWRGVDHSEQNVRERLYEKSLGFNIMNRNKRGVAIDLTTPDGVDLVKRLVATADAVIENYSHEVLPKLGLDYQALQAVRPSLVMVSMPAFGAGEWRDIRAYGSTLEQASGLPSVSGPPGAPPTHNQLAYGDPVGGLNGAAALLLGLMHRKRTGEGQHIDLSQVHGMLPLLAPWIIEHGIAGEVTRTGNRHPRLVPHGCFRCHGEDAWIALAVTEDAQWPELCRVFGREDLSHLCTVALRREAEDEIEAAVTAWAIGRTAEDAMAGLQALGVPAGVVRSPGEMYHDPHLLARGGWQELDRAWVGLHLQPSAPFREQGQPYSVQSPAPTVGEHNEAVLGPGGLGLTAGEMAGYKAAGVIGDVVVPVGERKTRRQADKTAA